MKKLREVIVVEGRYDKNTLAQVVDAAVIPLNGFSVFHDREKLNLLRRLADSRGLIILTDSDGAGFQLRNYLKGALPKERVKHAYIPDVRGKERRKRQPGKEGKLGVEGMRPAVLLEALRRAGAVFEDEAPDRQSAPTRAPITQTDLFEWGLTGGPDASRRRQALLKKLSLPEHLSSRGMLEVLNLLYSREEAERLAREAADPSETEAASPAGDEENRILK